jgi:hypothetical protein
MAASLLSSPGYRPHHQGGYPRVGSSQLYFADGSKMPGARINGRVQNSRMMGGGDQGPLATRGRTMRGPTPLDLAAQRQQNVAAARADGTFDAKRNAFNAANQGSHMDEAGNIGPKAPAPATSEPSKESKPAAQFTSVPDGQGGNKVVKVPAAAAPAAPATQAAPASKPVAASPVSAGSPAPRPPATFEGKSRAEWFGAAAKRQGVRNAYSGDAVEEAQKSPMLTRTVEKTVSPAPSQSTTPPAAKPTPAPAQASPPPSLGHSPETIQKAIDTAGKQTGVTAPTSSAPGGVRSMRGPMSVPSRNEVDLPSRGKASFAEGAQRATEHQQHINDLEQRAKNNLNAAQTQALKNPEGLSARFNPPGAQPKTLAEDPIAKPVIAAGKAIAPAIEATALTMAKTLNTRAAKNPNGVAAKVGRLLGAIPNQTGGGRLFAQNRTQR